MSTPTGLFAKRPNMLAGTNLRALAGPILICMILGMMILPLPPMLLDLLFTFNIALSVMVLLVSMYTMKPLDFAAFPSVLLFSTLLRLSLNVASTRVVLLEGHTGPDAAGQVIEAFGHFLVGGNFAVGIVVFVILMIINFMVITKGAGRIAEVSARFTLDAMPGKQMAIDADLNAGLINEEQARKRRLAVSQEAEFYGSMDGASKFVRGDAIAGLIIMAINVIGGLIVGMVQHDMSFAAAGTNYTLLTIGDGLVAQIPSLVISTAAGVIVSRVATDEDIGTQITGQLFTNPRVLNITGAIIVLMGLIPGMPHFAFLALGGGAIWLARTQTKRAAARKAAGDLTDIAPPAVLPSDSHEATWDDVQLIDPLGLEVGYRLIPLVDKNSDGELLKRIKSIRKKFAQEIGFLPPVIHIRDNLELRPNAYRIALKGVEIGVGEVFPGQWLAINPGQVTAALPGAVTQDPAFGLPAVWIDVAMREQAQVYGYTVVDASTVVATHLNHLVVQHAAELLGRQEVQSLVAHRQGRAVARRGPRAEDDLADDAAEGAAEPARGRRADPRHAHDPRSRVRTCGPRRCVRDHGRGAAVARPRDHAAVVSGRRRDAGDGPRLESRARAVAGARHRREPGPRTRPRAQPSDRHATSDAASTESRAAARAAGAARAARDARAFPAPQPAAIESAVVCRSAGHTHDQSR
ncbi:flagellar biosynthesis protein FlhA [Burkholderia contaminans]|nr:flagellar biosynthesis protein FlhA [Burkholderia contaminans]